MKRLTLLLVLLLTVVAVPASAQGFPEWILERGSLTVAYAHSFSSSKDGLIGKASVDFAEVKLPLAGRTMTLSADLLAIPEPDSFSVGVGGSATIRDAFLGINVGVGWLPKDYGWSWNATIIKLSF